MKEAPDDRNTFVYGSYNIPIKRHYQAIYYEDRDTKCNVASYISNEIPIISIDKANYLMAISVYRA